ncbi:MAG: YCF48-related protein [bacterium]
MKKIWATFISLFLVGFTSIAAQDYFEQTNGPLGGFISSIAIASNGDIYAGTSGWGYLGYGNIPNGVKGHGLYRSTDNGEIWLPINIYYHNILALGINSDGCIFAFGEENSAGYSYTCIIFSTDNGNTWLGNSINIIVNCFSADMYGRIYAGTSENGIYFSDDDGANWQQIGSSSNVLDINALLIDSSNYIYAGCPAGIFRSTDHGTNWTRVNYGITNSDIRSIVKKSNGDIFAGSYGGGVYRSTNNGDRWEEINAGLVNRRIKTLAISSNGEIYAGSDGDGVFISTDNGNNWNQKNSGLSHKSVNCLVLAANGDLFSCNHGGGIFKLKENTSNWVHNGLNITDITTLIINADGTIFASVYATGISKSTDNGGKWEYKNAGIAHPYVNAFVTTPNGNIYAGTGHWGSTEEGAIFRSTDGGDNWEQQKIPNNYIYSLAVNKITEVLFAGTTHGLYFSSDNGDNWECVGFEGLRVHSLSLNSNGEVFAFTEDGLFSSLDNGSTWNNLHVWGSYITIAPDDKVFCIQGKKLIVSTNNGISWDEKDLPTEYIYCLVADELNKIYLGSYGAIYSLKETEENWNVFNSGLPRNSINSIGFDADGYMYAATGGSGVFRSTNSITAIENENNVIPKHFLLTQNYPNPFNPSTTIKYSIPTLCSLLLGGARGGSNVILKVYDVLGREIATLVNEEKPAGNYELTFNGEGLPSGVYFYSLHAGDFHQTKKMLLLK